MRAGKSANIGWADDFKRRKAKPKFVVPTAEELIHRGIIDALELKVKPGIIYYHVPNGADMTPLQRGRMKRLGMLSGVPDLVFHLPGGRTGFLEIKRPDGGVLSLEQRAFRDAVLALCCQWEKVTSITEALAVLKDWGALR